MQSGSYVQFMLISDSIQQILIVIEFYLFTTQELSCNMELTVHYKCVY